MSLRVGIMGGTFDPIHIGHLVTAQEAYEQFKLDTVIFMVAGIHPLKRDSITPAGHRLAMTRLAIAGDKRFEVSDFEASRSQVTYTVDTLQYLRRQYSSTTEFFFITGADAVFEIVEWKDAQRLAGMVTFIGATRPGYDIMQAKQMHGQAVSHFDIRYLEVPALAVSSTDIRTRIREGRSIRYLVDDEVAGYLYAQRLYAESEEAYKGEATIAADVDRDAEETQTLRERAEALLKERLDEAGFRHSKGVATCAHTMATLYGEDPQDAYLAGLLHDWDRECSPEQLVESAQRCGIALNTVMRAHPRLLHAHTGAAAVAARFPQLKPSIIKAIESHTVGSIPMSDLDKIVYVADMIEPGRTYRQVESLRKMVGKVGLDALFCLCYQQSLYHLITHEKALHPDTLSVWNSLMGDARKEGKNDHLPDEQEFVE